jgi:hypothetical protein
MSEVCMGQVRSGQLRKKYQNMVNLVMRLSNRRYPKEFMNVTVRELRTFDNKIF